jgi:hypothetical protein
MPTHTTLRASPSVGDSLLSDQLEANLYSFLNWSLLGAGGFFNVTIPTSGCYGGAQHRLRPVTEPGVAAGKVWEAFRKDWVWESGVENDTQPIRVSGVFVDGSFVPVGTGLSVDYPNGRATFAEPRPATGVVTCEYSYRLYQLYTADTDWWQQLQTNSFRVDDGQFLQQGSGAWDVLSRNRVQLPAVVLEAVPNVRRVGLGLGGGQIATQDVLFHVLAEERWHLKWMHDCLTSQQDKRIYGFDKNRMFAADAFPLLPDGSPKPSGLMYPDLVKPSGQGGFFWEQIRFDSMSSQDQPRLGAVRYCTVRGKFQVDTP